uniref:Beta-1,3-galactosyl-O-glycosyl-glycoprotein beta-1,6-N-acetylglucosaminyltransferase 3 n=1 Tax=Cyprinus carpio TaxID=7962 RepID=A0A8C2IGJ0_CYPCA
KTAFLKYIYIFHLLKQDSFYFNATKHCPSYIRDRRFLTVSLSKEEKDFPIAYSMVIHEKIEMFERLLRSPEIFKRIQADINCMQDLVKSPVHLKYLLNTCGTHFPIKTNAVMVQSLKLLNGKNSLESETIEAKKGRWQYHQNVTNFVTRTDVKKSPPPIKTLMFSGNAYFVVSREFVEHIFKSKEIQDFMEWEKDTHSPDEHMWATLQRMPSVPGSNPSNIKYEHSDMNSIARELKNGAPYTPCTAMHRRTVCVYGAGDLKWIVQQHHLLANKFDPEVDDVAMKCMEAYVRYKAIFG